MSLDRIDEGGVTLSDIRRGILNKGHQFKIASASKRWYNNNKDDLLALLTDIVTSDNKTVRQKMQKFDTDPYFRIEKGESKRSLQPKHLMNALEYEFSSTKVADEYSKDKAAGLNDQYEKIVLDNGVEIYAVYTPAANIRLAHKTLHMKGYPTPGWCIASPSSAFNAWDQYDLYEAEAPCVFIVYKEGEPKKYELKGNPEKCLDFKNRKIRLKAFIDEWRDPQQIERAIESTTLFDTMGISYDTLENAIRHLMNSKKAKLFSAKYGKQMVDSMSDVELLSNRERIFLLTKIAQSGMLYKYWKAVHSNEEEYFLKELIKYNTLIDIYVHLFKIDLKETVANHLVKTERAGIYCLKYAHDKSPEAFREMLHQVDSAVYEAALTEFSDEAAKEICNAAIDTNSADGYFIMGIYEYHDDIFFGYFEKLIKNAVKNNKLSGIEPGFILDYKDYLEDETVVQACEQLLEVGENPEQVVYAMARIDDEYLNSLVPDFAKKYINSDRISAKGVTFLPEPWNEKCLEKLISKEKYSWDMIKPSFELPTRTKDYICKKLIKMVEDDKCELDIFEDEELLKTTYADILVRLYAEQHGRITTFNVWRCMAEDAHITTDTYMFLISKIDAKNLSEAGGHIEGLLYFYKENPEVVYVLVEKILSNLHITNVDEREYAISLLTSEEFKGTDIYTLGKRYANKFKGRQSDTENAIMEESLKVLELIAKRATEILSRSYDENVLKIYTELYYKTNGILNYTDKGQTKKARRGVTTPEWNAAVEDLYNRGIYSDKKVAEDKCYSIASEINNKIGLLYNKVAKSKIDNPDKNDIFRFMSPSKRRKILLSDNYFGNNPIAKCREIVFQELASKYL